MSRINIIVVSPTGERTCMTRQTSIIKEPFKNGLFWSGDDTEFTAAAEKYVEMCDEYDNGDRQYILDGYCGDKSGRDLLAPHEDGIVIIDYQLMELSIFHEGTTIGTLPTANILFEKEEVFAALFGSVSRLVVVKDGKTIDLDVAYKTATEMKLHLDMINGQYPINWYEFDTSKFTIREFHDDYDGLEQMKTHCETRYSLTPEESEKWDKFEVD